MLSGKLASLVRMQLYGTLGINRLLHATTAAERKKALALVLAAAAAGCVAFSLSWMVSKALSVAGRPDALPAIAVLLCSVAALGITFLKSSGLLAGGRDYDLMMSLPVTAAQAVVSRLLPVYLVNALLCIIIVVPAAAVYANASSAADAASVASVVNPANATELGAVLFALSAPVLPVIPMALALAIGTAVSSASARARRSNALSLALSTLLVLAFAIGANALSGMSEKDASSAVNALSEAARSLYPPAAAISSASAGDPLPLLALVVVSGIAAAAFVAIASALYSWLNNQGSQSAAKRSNIRLPRERSPFTALYQREAARYFSCTIYALNSSIGIVLLLLLSAVILFAGPSSLAGADVTEGFSFLSHGIPGGALGETLGGTLRGALPFFVALFISMTCTTSASLSLEGKSLWIACSLPVRTFDLLKAKMALNLSVIAPFALASIVLLALAVGASDAELVFLVLVPAVYACFISALGMAMNVRFPRYDWTSEYYAVKGGAVSVLATNAVGITSSIVPLALCLAFSSRCALIALVASAVLSAATIAICRYLATYRLYAAPPRNPPLRTFET